MALGCNWEMNGDDSVVADSFKQPEWTNPYPKPQKNMSKEGLRNQRVLYSNVALGNPMYINGAFSKGWENFIEWVK